MKKEHKLKKEHLIIGLVLLSIILIGTVISTDYTTIPHNEVFIKTDPGNCLSGGGDISENRSLALQLYACPGMEDDLSGGDYIVIVDVSDGGREKIVTLQALFLDFQEAMG